MDHTQDLEDGPLTMRELREMFGQTWALNLVDRSSADQLVFMKLVDKGWSEDKAWQAMLATAPTHNNQGLHDHPMGPDPERTAARHSEG